jgi:hypothetical protein
MKFAVLVLADILSSSRVESDDVEEGCWGWVGCAFKKWGIQYLVQPMTWPPNPCLIDPTTAIPMNKPLLFFRACQTLDLLWRVGAKAAKAAKGGDGSELETEGSEGRKIGFVGKGARTYPPNPNCFALPPQFCGYLNNECSNPESDKRRWFSDTAKQSLSTLTRS